jgi:hypothetical protein
MESRALLGEDRDSVAVDEEVFWVVDADGCESRVVVVAGSEGGAGAEEIGGSVACGGTTLEEELLIFGLGVVLGKAALSRCLRSSVVIPAPCRFSATLPLLTGMSIYICKFRKSRSYRITTMAGVVLIGQNEAKYAVSRETTLRLRQIASLVRHS